MAAVASMPSTPGMRTSMSTTSGRRAAVMLTPAAPSPASPTTVMSVFGLEDHPEAHPHQRLVIDEQDPDHAGIS